MKPTCLLAPCRPSCGALEKCNPVKSLQELLRIYLCERGHQNGHWHLRSGLWTVSMDPGLVQDHNPYSTVHFSGSRSRHLTEFKMSLFC